MKITLVYALTFLLSLSSYSADLFQIINRDCGNLTNSQCDGFKSALDDLELKVNAELPDADTSSYLKAMGTSAAISAKGQGTDYVNSFSLFALGLSVGLGADVGTNSTSDLTSGDIDEDQLRGVGFQGNLTVGLNLGRFKKLPKWGFFDLKRLDVFANFFSLSLDQFADELSGDNKSFGIHLRYDVMEPVTLVKGIFSWGGIRFNTGYEFSSLKAQFTQNIKETEDISGSIGQAEFDGTAIVGADIKTHSIPFEVSTSVSLLSLIHLYGGLGMDFNFGKARGIASLTGPITVSGTASAQNASADADLDVGEDSQPTGFMLRGFGGLHLGLKYFSVYTQVNKILNREGNLGFNAGIRMAF